MRNYKLDYLGISECSWTGFGRSSTTKEQIIYSCKEERHKSGVVITLPEKAAAKSLSYHGNSSKVEYSTLESTKTTLRQQ